MLELSFKPGDCVVYRKVKYSSCPGPRAKDIEPAKHGEDYSYCVDKYWVVVESRGDKGLLLRTRRGKQHEVTIANPNLRHAHWWERWFYGHRFPSLEESTTSVGQAPM